MLGFGKKPEANDPPPASPETAAAAPKIEASDEQLIVMPEEYLPKAELSGKSGSKKLYFVIIGAVVFLLALSGGLYYFLFAGSPAVAPVVVLPPLPNTAPPASETATTTPVDLKIITSQALDAVGQLLGSIKISLPSLVANKYGEALGVAVLSATDIAVPSGTALAGGIYSPYPVGAIFDEPVLVDLIAANLSTPESRQNYYPAFLKGTAWQEITPASETADGWSFSFNKFPAGPISLVERAATSTMATAPGILGAGKPVASLDTDKDGLTDEEEALLGTNREQADTDNDTYSDRAEIFNGYSPLTATDKLEAAGLFTTYTNPTYGYKAPYPKKWLADSLDQTNKQVLFISATEEFFEILVEENPAKQPIVDWYRAQSPALANAQLDVSTIDGAAAVWSPDGLTLYVGREGLVYILTYNKGQVEQINWLTFFEYFYKNFKFGNTASQTAAPAAAATSASQTTAPSTAPNALSAPSTAPPIAP